MGRYSSSKRTDPVCGQKIDPASYDFLTVVDRHSFYFCSQRCLDRFNQDRERFTRASRTGIKGIWSRYLHRVQKATDGKPPCCH